jgi:histidinol phosphatase-like enzyme (inositol monophosphatase family)
VAGEPRRELLEFAVEVAEKAGEITLRYFQGRFEIEKKADDSPVTVADREAETYVRRAIESRFPDDGIIGEEFGELRPQATRRWIVDPIDGTFSFVHGVPLYGVLIGIEEGDEATVGVIRLPALGETIAAAKGEGCRWRGRPAGVSAASDIGEAVWLTTAVGFGIDSSGSAGLDRVTRASGHSRTWGDCYGYALVATGRADIMIDPLMNIWDCAPLLPIVEEAGGRFTDWQGRRTIRGGNAVATNGLLHNQVLALLQSQDRRPLPA